MNTIKTIEELERNYPGSKIIKLPEEQPTEIICEIEPTKVHPAYSLAISIIDRSIPHYHNVSTETYEVVKGNLTVNKNGKEFKLHEGQKLTVSPKEVHFANGNETWIKVYSKPGWTSEDHFLMDVRQIIGDYKAFFSDLIHRLAKLQIDINGMAISHLCYRVTTISEYERLREQLKAFCAAFVEAHYNGRPISRLLLKSPLALSEDHFVSLIELPAPRAAHKYSSGLEHVGIIVGETLPAFKKQYKNLLTGEKDRGKYCQPAFITFDNGKTVKFYERPLQEVIQLEGTKFLQVR